MDTKTCSAYARLGMLKLCCEVDDKFADGSILTGLHQLGSASTRTGEAIVRGSDKAADGALTIMGAGLVVGLIGAATVVLALPGILVGALLALLGIGTGMISNVTRKAGNLIKRSGTSAGKNLFGTGKKLRGEKKFHGVK